MPAFKVNILQAFLAPLFFENLPFGFSAYCNLYSAKMQSGQVDFNF